MWARLLLAALLMWGVPAQAGTFTSGGGAGTFSVQSSAPRCSNQNIAVPFPLTSPLTATVGTGLASTGSAGRIHCAKFSIPCNVSYTRGFMRVATLLAGSQLAFGVYTVTGPGTGTGGDAVYYSGVVSGAATGRIAGAVMPFTLEAGRVYWWCQAGSDIGTLKVQAFATDPSTVPSSYAQAANAAASFAQFNALCTAAVTPWACCTGLTTGNCTGIPNPLPALTANTASVTTMAGSLEP